jgi:hypothetical protein
MFELGSKIDGISGYGKVIEVHGNKVKVYFPRINETKIFRKNGFVSKSDKYQSIWDRKTGRAPHIGMVFK